MLNEPKIDEIDFSKKVLLILGNGSSRLKYLNFIQQWKGEIWGCNSIYKELQQGILHRLDAMTGDKIALKDALQYREHSSHNFKVWSRGPLTHTLKGVERINVEQKYIYDSGTTLVCKALLDGYDHIYLIGFDLGGSDIYVSDHEKRNKQGWVKRWRLIADEFGLDKITFIGYDHKSFILSKQPLDMYARIYMKGKDHLSHNYNSVEPISNDVMILGNGESRKDFDYMIKKWQKELWVCNEAYKEAITKKYKITRVCSVHPEMICEAYDFSLKHNLNYFLWSKLPIEGLENKHYLFREQKGWSTGALAVCQAILEDFDKIYLLGFDFGGADLYKDYSVEGSNFKKQFIGIRKLYPTFKEKVEFLGKQPYFLYKGVI